MSDSRWQNDATAGAGRGMPWWVKVPLVMLVAGAALAVFLTVSISTTRSQAWPTVRQVIQRISTEESARQLWAANPVLMRVYPSSDAFIEMLQTWRPRFGDLPPAEPAEGRDAYLVSGGMDNLRLSIRGTGGAWMTLSVVRPGPFLKGTDLGEGVTDIGFAESVQELRGRRQKLLRAADREESLQEWIKFREIAAQLGSDEGVERLLKDNPLLPEARNPGSFKSSVRAWRSCMEALPSTFQGARGFVKFSRREGLGETTTSLSYRFSQGGSLTATWKGGKLIRLDLVS